MFILIYQKPFNICPQERSNLIDLNLKERFKFPVLKFLFLPVFTVVRICTQIKLRLSDMNFFHSMKEFFFLLFSCNPWFLVITFLSFQQALFFRTNFKTPRMRKQKSNSLFSPVLNFTNMLFYHIYMFDQFKKHRKVPPTQAGSVY